jgi:mitochondrial-processing peptidase subunit alpha
MQALLSRRSLDTCRRRLSQLANAKSPQITTLPNKIRVATESTPGHFASIGMFVDAGARYETPTSSGASHFIDRMAFKVFSCIL